MRLKLTPDACKVTANAGVKTIGRCGRGGATGGVRRIAIQLARASGAHVTALVRDAEVSQELEDSWREAARALEALRERRIGGKAVLHVD
jgi:hypothetical protein